MTRNDSDRVNDLFTASSRDLTPAPVRHAARVLYAPVSHDPDVTRRCASVLSDAELQRAGRFATQGDKALFKQRRAFRRFCGALALGSSRPYRRSISRRPKTGFPTFPVCRISGLVFPPAGSVFSGRGRQRMGSASTSKTKRRTWRLQNSPGSFFRQPRRVLLRGQAAWSACGLSFNSGASRKRR